MPISPSEPRAFAHGRELMREEQLAAGHVRVFRTAYDPDAHVLMRDVRDLVVLLEHSLRRKLPALVDVDVAPPAPPAIGDRWTGSARADGAVVRVSCRLTHSFRRGNLVRWKVSAVP